MQPTSILFVKVVVKQRPYSNEPVNIAFTAATFEGFTASSVQYYASLPLGTTLAHIEDTIAKLQTLANTAEVRVKMQPKVHKFIEQ